MVSAGGCYPNPDDLRASGSSGSGSGGCQGVACTGSGTGGTTGTGTGGSGDGGVPPGFDTAAYASAICDRFQTCAPGRVSFAFGTQAACQARLKIAIDAVMPLPDIGWTAANLAACANAQRAQLCSDFNDGKIPAACNVMGKRITGQACRTADQCASLRCLGSLGQCGTCAPRGGAGASCVGDEDCTLGLVCTIPATGTGTCVTPRTAGSACDPASTPCLYSLSCRDGFCSAPGRAQTPCEDFEDCDDRNGFLCNFSTFVCGSATASTTTCGAPASNGSLQYCPASGYCSLSGTCLAAAADNRSCSNSAGPLCTFPAACLNGTCTLPSSADCR